MARDDSDAAKWARAEVIAAGEAAYDKAMHEEYLEFKRIQAVDSRFSGSGPAEVIHMFRYGVNEKGEPLSQFEFEALCERWCAVFGELPPMETTAQELPNPTAEETATADPLPPDDAMLSMKDVVRIAGVSKSTIKRWATDRDNDFPKPVKLSPRRIGWRADLVKDWRKRIESAGSDRSH